VTAALTVTAAAEPLTLSGRQFPGRQPRGRSLHPRKPTERWEDYYADALVEHFKGL
jgi:hypothetical protein